MPTHEGNPPLSDDIHQSNMCELAEKAKSGDKELFLRSWNESHEETLQGVRGRIVRIGKISPDELTVLTHAAKNGDNDALSMLFEAYKKRFLNKIIKMSGSRVDPEDVYQETFFRALKELHEGKFDPTRAFYIYISRKINFVISDLTPRGEETRFPAKQENSASGDGTTEEMGRSGSMPYTEPVPPDRPAQYLEMCRLVCECGAKPHQVISLFFSKLLKWKPSEMVKELSDLTLDELAQKFYDEYSLHYMEFFEEDILYEAFSTLFEKMDILSEVCYSEDEYKEKIIGYKRVGDMPLKVFFTSNSTQNISDWSNKTLDRARNALREGTLSS